MDAEKVFFINNNLGRCVEIDGNCVFLNRKDEEMYYFPKNMIENKDDVLQKVNQLLEKMWVTNKMLSDFILICDQGNKL